MALLENESFKWSLASKKSFLDKNPWIINSGLEQPLHVIYFCFIYCKLPRVECKELFIKKSVSNF